MSEITTVDAWEVLDSRGNPTVRVRVETAECEGVFTVPAGASTGTFEAVEKRDSHDRFGGLGVRTAVNTVRDELASVVTGYEVTDQAVIDETMVDCDGTETLSRLGANAVLGVSGAVAHAASRARNQPLYESLARTGGDFDSRSTSIPMPMVNVLSGGLHAEGGIEIQDFLIVPTGAETYPDALEMVWAVREAVRSRIVADGHRPLVADEGGFAPPLANVDEAFELLEACVADAGYACGEDVLFAVDVAATHFYDDAAESYELASVGRTLDRSAMIDLVLDWVEAYPIVSIEDPLAEDDWTGWERLSATLGSDVQLLGDDFLVTNTDRLTEALDRRAANSVLVKPNQAGTVTRAIDVIRTAKRNGANPVVSARSGETSDATIADLAVGLDAGQMKIGSLCRSERLAKYNRLLEIDRSTDNTTFASPFERDQ